MPPTTPSSVTGPVASAQTRLRTRGSSAGTDPNAVQAKARFSRRDGLLSGPEDRITNDDSRRQGYARNKSNSDNPRNVARAEETLTLRTGNQDGTGGRGTRTDKNRPGEFEQSYHRGGANKEALAAASLLATANGVRVEAGAGRTTASRGKTKRGNRGGGEPTPTRRQKELRGLAELVQAELERAADAQVFEHLKRETTKAFQEMAVLRAELGRAEAAVEGGKKQRDTDIAALEDKLKKCQQDLHRSETEGESHRIQHAKGAEEEAKLREDLKTTQEALSFLSAWDEEKVELDAEVASLKDKLAAAIGEGNQRLADAQHEFSVAAAVQGHKARSRFEIDADKARLELEKGLSDEFRNHRRENDILRRQKDHHDGETIRMIKSVARLEAEGFAARAELEEERRMHHTTIRRKKRADTVIAELQAQLNISLLPRRPAGTPRISPYPTYALRTRVPPVKGTWNSRPSPRPSPPTGRAKMMYRDGEEAYRPSPGGGGSRTTKEGVESSSRATNKGVGGEVKGYEGCGVLPGCKERAKDDETKSAGERTGQNASKVSSLLMPARPSDRRRGNLAKKAGSSLVTDSLAALDNMAADERLQLSAGGRKRRRNSSQGVVSGSSSCFDDSMSISRWSNTDLGGNREKDQGRDADSTFGALRPGGSDVSSTDVWTMLDSYVHGRAEVAKANRHVRAIEAMRRRHLAKAATRIVDAAGIDDGGVTKYNRGRGRQHRDARTSSNSDECVWRASRKMWVERRSRTGEAVRNGRGAEVMKSATYVKGRRRTSGEEDGVNRATPWKPMKARNHTFQPRPPRHARSPGDGCMPGLSQRTSAEHFHGENNDVEAGGEGRSPNGYPDEILVRTDHFPSVRHRSLHPHDANDDCNHFGYTDDDAHESPITSVAIRPPSSTTPATSPTRAGVVRAAVATPLHMAGRLWGKDVNGGVLMKVAGGRGGGAESGNLARRGRGGKAGRWSQLGGLGRKRRTCRDVELADWIEANTNLVNVSPW